MGFIKTSLAVTFGILGALGLIAVGQELSENGNIDHIKARVLKAKMNVQKKAEASDTDTDQQ